MSSSKNPLKGVDLAEARQRLAGAEIGVFDADLLVTDDAGHVAVLLGTDELPAPRHGAAAVTSAALEAIFARAVRSSSPVDDDGGYRVADVPDGEAVFDPPRAAEERALHERPLPDYPQLVVATTEGAAIVRAALETYGGEEVLASDGFAARLAVVGPITFEELHAGACAGCRNLDDPRDPRVRSPELLARAGLFVYGVGEDRRWLRIASPTRPVRREDVAGAPLFGVEDLRFADDATLPRELTFAEVDA